MAVVVNHQGRRTIDGVGTFEHGSFEVPDGEEEFYATLPGFSIATEEETEAFKTMMLEDVGAEVDQDREVWTCLDCDPPKVYKTEKGYDTHVTNHHPEDES